MCEVGMEAAGSRMVQADGSARTHGGALHDEPGCRQPGITQAVMAKPDQLPFVCGVTHPPPVLHHQLVAAAVSLVHACPPSAQQAQGLARAQLPFPASAG